MDVNGRAHELRDVDRPRHGTCLALVADQYLLGTNTCNHRDPVPDTCRHELRGRLIGHGDRDLLRLDDIAGTCVRERRVKEVHLWDADEARHKEVGRAVEDLLGCAHLLDHTILHDNDAITQGHGLGLVVGDIHEGRVDALAQLDDLGAHLVAQLRVEVRERLVHEQDLGVAHDSAPDGDALALAARERLGLALEVLRDAQDLGGLAHLLVYLVLGGLAELQRKGQVVVDRHVRVEGIALEDHGDVSVLRGDIVHERAADVELAARYLLEARHHAQRRGLTAARGTYEHHELTVRDLEVKVLHGDDALVGHLEVALLFGLTLLALALLLKVWIDFLYMLQA